MPARFRMKAPRAPELPEGRLYLARLMISRWGCAFRASADPGTDVAVMPPASAATAICISDYMPFPMAL